MRNGKVKWFDDDKGYGFIIPDDGSRDVFVHKRDLLACGVKDPKSAMTDGRAVRFRDEDNPRNNGGKIAKHVEFVE